MRQRDRKILQNSRGSTLISTLIAAAVIVCAIGGVGASSVYLRQTLKRTEVVSLAVAMEAGLVNAFNNKENFKTAEEVAVINQAAAQAATGLGHPGDQVVTLTSPNEGLRKGTLTQFSLKTPFGNIPLTVRSAADTGAGTIGYLRNDLTDCGGTAFSATCVIKYEVRLLKTQVAAGLSSYAFSYQIDVNPDVVVMSSLGSVNSYDSPIDPGSYRVGQVLARCDSASDLFMTGINRDTGEAYCAKKPLENRCPNGQLPKGLNFVPLTGQTKSGTIKLECPTEPMRTFTCPSNYALETFEPAYSDPMNTRYGNSVPAKCVFITKNSVMMNDSYPPDPTSPYRSQVTGYFCPPFYKASGDACHLVPDTARNASREGGMGRCGEVRQRNCRRYNYTDELTRTQYTNYVSWYNYCSTSLVPYLNTLYPPVPPAAPTYTIVGICGSYSPPSEYNWETTCSETQISANCSGDVPPGRCENTGGWTPELYAVNIHDVEPSSEARASFDGRNVTCTLVDTTEHCPGLAGIPDINGRDWGWKDPQWFGGVKVSGLTCSLPQEDIYRAAY